MKQKSIKNAGHSGGGRVDFISLMAHQLRAPLVSLRWFLDMLGNGSAGPLNDDQKFLVGNLSEILDHLKKLEEVLLRVGRLDSGRVIVQPEPLDLLLTVRGAVDALKPFVMGKHLTVCLYSVPEQLPKVPADPEFLWQLLQILLTNAINYSPPNTCITLSIEYTKDNIMFSVRDQGIGIPHDEQDKIFSMFYRATNARKFDSQGSGLGLSLAQSLVESWGGRIWVESELGKGSVFRFTLPNRGMKRKDGQVTLTL